MTLDLERPRVICGCCGRRTVACVRCGRLILREDGPVIRRQVTPTRIQLWTEVMKDPTPEDVCSLCDPEAWGCAGDPFEVTE